MGQDGQKQIVTAVNAAAMVEGLGPGMPLTQARAIFPHVRTVPAQPLEDAKALHRLASGCLRFSPWVAPVAPDGLCIDATGVAHLFGGEPAMVAKIAKTLKRSGLNARIAMANTPGAAWALSHYGPRTCVVSAAREDLDPLPVSALRIGADVARALRRVGLHTIGALKAIPRATLPLRFGKDLVTRLDQALGQAPEPIDCILPPQARRREIAFAEPISTPDDLHRTAARLVDQLCRDLEDKQEGARKLDLVFRRVDNSIQVIRIGTGRPARDPKHLLKLLSEHMDSIAPGFGIEAASLTAWRVAPLYPTQVEADGSGEDPGDLAMLTDHLANRLGPKSVYRLTPVASHMPERAQKLIAPTSSPSPDGWPENLPRPVRLFAPPEAVEVTAMLPDSPPVRFFWQGQMRKVRCADGPERVCGEWWLNREDAAETRDYFRVEDEQGGRYWLFRDNRITPNQTHAWFVHGIFA